MSEIIKKATQRILDGEIVVFPTETVYGIGADATNDYACRKIFEIKSRPLFNPLIIHISSIEEAEKYGEFTDKSRLVAEKLWPGPITIVTKLKKLSGISKYATSSLDTIALRIPSHEMALDFIKSTKKPIAAPSANKSGFVSPTRYSHVRKNFIEDILILDGGKSTYGIESTIIDLSNDIPKILRYGFIDSNILSTILGENISFEESYKIIKAPGALKKHYSTRSKIRINASNADKDEVVINFGNSSLLGAVNYNLSVRGDLIEAAANLYDILINADEDVISKNLQSIAIAHIPNISIGLAINDKLLRASSL